MLFQHPGPARSGTQRDGHDDGAATRSAPA